MRLSRAGNLLSAFGPYGWGLEIDSGALNASIMTSAWECGCKPTQPDVVGIKVGMQVSKDAARRRTGDGELNLP
jgi:hypothetical protein